MEKKKGFVKSPRQIEYEVFGPTSTLPAKWRVFFFIKYKIQDNKRHSQSESMSRDYIVKNTGICEKNFRKIIKNLEKENFIEVVQGKYRNSSSTYCLSKNRFTYPCVSSDQKSEKQPVETAGLRESPRRFDGNGRQIDAETDVSVSNSFRESPSIPSSSIPSFLNPRAEEKVFDSVKIEELSPMWKHYAEKGVKKNGS